MQLNLLPLDDETVDQKLASFRNYDDEVTTHTITVWLNYVITYTWKFGKEKIVCNLPNLKPM